MINSDDLRQLLFQIVLTKLEAREFITSNIVTLEEVKNTLKEKIKPDNSSVVKGRMANLKLKDGKSTEFAEQVEKTDDALRRTLIIEGMTSKKANEEVIEKTIEVCRRNAKSILVKSVLEATRFEDPCCHREKKKKRNNCFVPGDFAVVTVTSFAR